MASAKRNKYDLDALKTCFRTTDFREVLARKDVDAVMITTPDHWHVASALAAINAGKDVACEKPIGLCVAHGRILADAAAKAQCVFPTDVPLVHLVEKIELPARIVTDEEYAIAKKVCAGFDAKNVRDKTDTWTRSFYGRVCERYEAQHQGHRLVAMELHVLRLGDVAIATSPFELFVDYGVQIQARSAAEQTFVIQLAATAGFGLSSYGATSRAVAGGALTADPFTNYSATVASTPVGPEGAQVLVDRTVEAIRELWQSPGK